MALSEYKGSANSSDIFQHLVGEKVTACFEHEGRVWLVVESGHAFVVGGPSLRMHHTEGNSFSVYWREPPEEVRRIVAQRREAIAQRTQELRDMAGVDLS